MAKKQNENIEESAKQVEAIDNALSKTELFIERNRNILLISLAVVMGIAVIWLAFQYLYLTPKNEEAQEKLAVAQELIASQQYLAALEGDSVAFDGLEDLIDNYGITKSGKLAKAYAGFACYRLSRYEDAIDYLKSFSASDEVLKYTAQGTIGDCYVQLQQVEEAIPYFKKAAKADNPMVAAVYSFKLARVYEDLNRDEDALNLYKEIKKEYMGKVQGVSDLDEVDKFIERLELKNGK